MRDKKLYDIVLSEIVPYGERALARRHLSEGDWVNQHAGGETRQVGQRGQYAAWLDERAAADYLAAVDDPDSNVESVEEAERHHVLGEFVPGVAQISEAERREMGVNRDALADCGFMDVPDDLGTAGRGVIVGVGDTGYTEGLHPYTDDRFKFGANFTADPSLADNNGHSTWVAGAATPGRATLAVCKVLGDDGYGYSSWNIAGANWVAELSRAGGVKAVYHNSLGANSLCSAAYDEAARHLREAGVVWTAASGNDGFDDRICSPGSCERIMAGGAYDRHNGRLRASFSNADLAADTDAAGAGRGDPQFYAPGVVEAGQGGSMSGTSMSSPFGARAAAVVYARGEVERSNRGAGSVTRALREGARDRDAATLHGVGRLWVPSSLEIARRGR